jgi:hypothetical protein
MRTYPARDAEHYLLDRDDYLRLCRVMTKLFESNDRPEFRTADARRDMAQIMNDCLGRALPHGRTHRPLDAPRRQRGAP